MIGSLTLEVVTTQPREVDFELAAAEAELAFTLHSGSGPRLFLVAEK
jgi:hypothetical protein